jgi:NAD(P)-dependent dehydrogenase (short-subunit alcohol dehydrogenase family)
VELQGKVAIVTGGAVRIGRAISLALADAGAAVVVHSSHSDAQARQTAEEIISGGGQAVAVSADFSNPVPAATSVMQAAIDRFGRVDVLINSAAIFAPGTLASTSEADWDRHFAINLKSPCFLCREFAARHTPGNSASIVNIADWRGLRPAPGHLAYTLTKAALVALTEILAQELAPEIRVNAIAPGAILPPAGAGQDYMERLAENVPLRRSGSVDDVASAVLFLLRSDFITGEVLRVTGGEDLP